jgi:hypothetical protein
MCLQIIAFQTTPFAALLIICFSYSSGILDHTVPYHGAAFRGVDVTRDIIFHRALIVKR